MPRFYQWNIPAPPEEDSMCQGFIKRCSIKYSSRASSTPPFELWNVPLKYPFERSWPIKECIKTSQITAIGKQNAFIWGCEKMLNEIFQLWKWKHIKVLSWDARCNEKYIKVLSRAAKLQRCSMKYWIKASHSHFSSRDFIKISSQNNSSIIFSFKMLKYILL